MSSDLSFTGTYWFFFDVHSWPHSIFVFLNHSWKNRPVKEISISCFLPRISLLDRSSFTCEGRNNCGLFRFEIRFNFEAQR